MKALLKVFLAASACLACIADLSWAVDSDGDGLSDEAEIVITGTNPNVWDTDGDGLGDLELGEVVAWGWNFFGQASIPSRVANAVAVAGG